MVSIIAEAAALLDAARAASSGRASHTLVGGSGHALRQTLVALLAGQELSEHENPGEATVHVIAGRVELQGDGQSDEGGVGELLVVPDARHSLRALEDCVVLLTVAKHA